jgi:hypothetical protein
MNEWVRFDWINGVTDELIVCMLIIACIVVQVIQHQTVKYHIMPLSPLSKHRLSQSSQHY